MTLDQVLESATVVILTITALTGLVTAVRVGRKVDAVQRTTDENHKMLNQDRTDRLNYQSALIRALETRGIEVPVDQSAPTPPATDR